MQLTLVVLKLNCSLLDVVLTKPSIPSVFTKLLLSLIQSTLQKRSSNHHYISFKFTQQQFYKNFANSFLLTRRIQSNFGNILAVATGCFIKLLTMNLNHLILFLFSHTSLCEITAKKRKCDDLSNNWKMVFQASDLKGRHFLDLYNSDNNIIKPLYAKGIIT